MTDTPDPAEIEREIEFHLQETIDGLLASGMTEEDARREAERRYGDRARHATAMRSQHASPPPHRRLAGLLASLATEIRLAARSLRRAPGFTATAVATLALVSGANLTMFGVADALTNRPLAYLGNPDEVHRLYWQWTDEGRVVTAGSMPYTRYVDLTRDGRAFAEAAVFAQVRVPVGDEETTEESIAAVSASWFRLFDATPLRGRFFSDDEDVVPRGADVTVVGHHYWQTRLGGREVIGEVLRIGDIRATIIGIAPEGFDGLNDGRPPAAFVPATTYAASTGTDDARTYFSDYKWGWTYLLVRRAAGIDQVTATADATRVFAASWPQSVADNSSLPPAETAAPRAVLAPLRVGAGPVAGEEARTALWLLAVATAVFLIGCANIANLALTRALSRRDEVGLKRALGVPAARLASAAFLEAGLLALAGGVASLLVAFGLRAVLEPVLAPLHLVDVQAFNDARMLTVTGLIVVAATLLVGLMPAVVVRRPNFGDAMRTGTRAASSHGRRTRAVLLATQAMLSVVLIISAGLFVRSLLALHAAPLGYDPDRVLHVSRRTVPGSNNQIDQRALRDQLLAAARALPDVERAAWVSSAPFISTSSTDLYLEHASEPAAGGPFTYQATTADYFNVMGTRVVRGRALGPTDGEGTPAAAVVSESMARTLWPGLEPLGQCFRMRAADGPCRAVVGIAEDMVQLDLTGGPRLHYYVPIEQYPRTSGNGMLLLLRGDPDRLGEPVRAALQEHVPAGLYLVATPIKAIVADQRSPWSLGTYVLVGFGLLALLVAGVGLFGAVNYDITQRSREWAIRMALGASRQTIVRTVIGRGVLMVMAGVALGLVAAAGLGRWLEPLLYHTSPRDPLTFAVAAACMIGVALVASLVPARQAAREDPGRALKGE